MISKYLFREERPDRYLGSLKNEYHIIQTSLYITKKSYIVNCEPNKFLRQSNVKDEDEIRNSYS